MNRFQPQDPKKVEEFNSLLNTFPGAPLISLLRHPEILVQRVKSEETKIIE